MNLEVKGHSGCQIDIVPESDGLYVYKSTADPKYLKRLALQAEKQQKASQTKYQHIRIPEIVSLEQTGTETIVKMPYIYSKNFIEFFEQAGFEQIDYLINALTFFIDDEIAHSPVQKVPALKFHDKMDEIRMKCSKNRLFDDDAETDELLDKSEKVFKSLPEYMEIPIGTCHGDLTFSNILFNGNNYYLIDFLDNFIETPLQDICKLRQDTAYRWSQLMYTKRFDAVRLHIICDKIDKAIDEHFSGKYGWYNQYYHIMQLMNILRIFPYAKEQRVVDYLKRVISSLLTPSTLNPSTLNPLNSEALNPLNSEALNPLTPSPLKHLLIPAAADKPEYENDLPYIFSLNSEGIVICLKSILGLDLKQFDNIYFTILKKHNDKFSISDLLDLQFNRLGITNAKVVILDEPTIDQSETIYQTIKQEQIEGSIFIKDADSYFKTEITHTDSVAIYPIEDLVTLAPKDKSYVAVDDMFYITNIIEKSVIGHHISAGGYYIERATDFINYYNRLRQHGKLYLSHIVYAMLLDKKSFRPMLVENYKDWGTLNDLRRNE